MDDFVLFDETKARLRASLGRVDGFLREQLELELKARATTLAPAHQGLPFLGWRIYRGTTRVRPTNKKRLRSRLRHRRRQVRRGSIDEQAYLASLRSCLEHLRHGDTLSLRRRWVEELTGSAPGSKATTGIRPQVRQLA